MNIPTFEIFSYTPAQCSAAALTMRWFLRPTGMIDLHGRQCIQSVSVPVARFMMVQTHVEVK